MRNSKRSRKAPDVRKASRRDFGAAVALKQNAATTVSATMALAHAAGIRVFATGGIGGAHRDAEPFDISADLTELARTPVLVVCAGAKSILHLPRTLEILETLGVPVVGYRTDAFPGVLRPRSRRRGYRFRPRRFAERRGGAVRGTRSHGRGRCGAGTAVPGGSRGAGGRVRPLARGRRNDAMRGRRDRGEGHAVPARSPRGVERRAHARGQPRADRGERAARGRSRGVRYVTITAGLEDPLQGRAGGAWW